MQLVSSTQEMLFFHVGIRPTGRLSLAPTISHTWAPASGPEPATPGHDRLPPGLPAPPALLAASFCVSYRPRAQAGGLGAPGAGPPPGLHVSHPRDTALLQPPWGQASGWGQSCLPPFSSFHCPPLFHPYSSPPRAPAHLKQQNPGTQGHFKETVAVTVHFRFP